MSSNGQTFSILREREKLLIRCDAQRSDIAATIDQLQVPLKVIDRAVASVNYVRGHPLVLGVALALLVVIRPRGWVGWLRRGYMMWRAYRAFSGSVAP